MSILNEYKPYSSQLIMQSKNQLDFVLSDCTNPTIELNSGLTTRGMITYFDFIQYLYVSITLNNE